MGLKGETYKQRTMSQLENWAKGKSIHNKKDDECCPDFSCCNKKIKTSIAERVKFMELYKEGGITAIAQLSADYSSKAIATEGHIVRSSRPMKHFEDDGAYAD